MKVTLPCEKDCIERLKDYSVVLAYICDFSCSDH
uniref:Uncharacterized protein n=1 Tax=Arundo donax TaxID=35708 RepID=A0A0A9FH54_ARUDO